MTQVADHFIGRAAELEATDRALAALRDGWTAPLAIEGEPGIGKTRLVGELAQRANARGYTVLTGSASELERDLPFWVFVDALDEYVAGLDPRVLGSLSEEARSELALLLPSLSVPSATGAAVPLQDERYRAHRAVRELLERLAVRGPLVLTLDDVHWADPASVELLAALLRSPPDAAVLVVLAARPRQWPGRLATAMERADRQGGLAHLELGGLPREAAGDLLGADVGRERADELYAEAGGNPFYLQQLARSHGAAAAGGLPGLEVVGVPAPVIASIAQELGLLAEDTRRVLRGAAVAGDPFELDLAAAAAGADDLTAMAAFDELLALGLVRRTDVPRRFRFRHPLVRRAVYETVPGGWLLGAHERCAAVLAERGARAAARAHHVEFAARAGDLAAVAVLAEAGAGAILRAPASAARWFSAALRLLPEQGRSEQRVELLLARARALAAQGRLAESHADLLECIALAPADALSLRVQLTTTCAGVERLLGRHEEAHTRLRTSFEELPDPAAADAIALMIELAIDGLFRADPDSVRDWARRALEAAEALGNRPLVAAAAAMLALGHAVGGSIGEAQEAYIAAARLLSALSDEELGARVDAAAYLCSAATYLDLYDDAVAHAERALRIGRSAGHLHPTLIPALGAAHMLRGRLAEAAEVLDGGVEAARLAGIVQSMAWMLRNRALTAAAAGDLAAALDMAEEALELTLRLDESVLASWAAMTVAKAAVMSGNAQRAVDVVGRADAADVLLAIPGAWRVMGLESLATAYADLDRGAEAASVAAVAEAHASALGLPLGTAWAQRASAVVALHAGEVALAADHALASAAAAEQAGAVLEAAFSRMVAGRALAAAGEVDRAGEEIERAAVAFEACGALSHRNAAEQELRRLGRRVHRRTRPGTADADGLAALTERELQLADLVADRRTNPEIAAELFLSPKTVESHLRNIFRKVGVSSRVELARAVERARRDA